MRGVQASMAGQEFRVVDVSVRTALAGVFTVALYALWSGALELSTGVVLVGLAGSVLLVRRISLQRIALGSWLVCVLLWSVVTAVNTSFGGAHAPAAAGYVIVVVLASLLLGSRAAVLFGVLSTLAAGLLMALELNGVLRVFQLPTPPWSSVAVLAAILVWTGMVLHFGNRGAAGSDSAFHESDEFLRSVMKSSPDHIMRLDRDARIVFINHTVPDLTIEEVRGRPIYDFVAAKYHEEMKSCFQRVFETGRHDSYYVDYESADGEILSFESRVSPIASDGGTVALTVTSTNVTDRVRSGTEVRRLASLVENSRDFIALADLRGKMIYVNRAGLSMVGIASNEGVQATSITDYLREEDREMFHDEVLPALHEKGVWRGEYCVRHRETGRAIPVEVNSFIVRDAATGDALSIATINREITKRKEAEAALALSERQLQQAQKMEAVGMLAGGVAHDFNNILTVITGYTDLVLHADQLTDSARKRLEGIAAASEKASSLTRQLLAFSRSQVLQPRVLDLAELLHDMEKMLSRVIGEDVKLVTSFSERLGNVKADPGQIEQVVMNLAINARHAMPSGGVLTLETKEADIDDNAPLSKHPPKGAYVLLKVSDTGTGMDREVLEHIFEPFFTTKELGRGTGLGLSTVYGIVKQSGGYIYAESDPGKGSSFTVYLPRVAECAEESPVPVENVANGSESILVVEDDEAVRSLASEVLRARGYDAIAAESGEEAVALIQKRRAVELLITDVVMPRMNGRELAKRLMELRPELKVLYMSGYSAKFMSNRGDLEDNAELIEKPFTPQGLADKVREVLDASREVAPSGRGVSAPRPS